MMWITRLTIVCTLAMLAYSFPCGNPNSNANQGERTVFLTILSEPCGSPISGVNIAHNCNGNSQSNFEYEEIATGVYKYSGPTIPHVLHFSKAGFEDKNENIASSDDPTVETIYLSCTSGTTTCEGSVASQLNINDMCPDTQDEELLVLWQDNVTPDTANAGIYTFGLCPRCTTEIHAIQGDDVVTVPIGPGDNLVTLGCNGCLIIDVLLVDSDSGSPVTCATLSLPYIVTSPGVYQVTVCPGDTELTISRGGYNGEVIALPNILPGQWQIQLTAMSTGPVDGHVGTSFLTSFMANSDSSQIPYLYITAENPTNVRVVIPYLGIDVTHSVTGSIELQFSYTLVVQVSEQVVQKGVHVTSDDPISLYSLNKPNGIDTYSFDGSLILPVSMLGTDYIVHTHDISTSYGISQISIVAIEDGTVVSYKKEGGSPTTVNLNKFDVYQIQASDLSGALVEATHKVQLQMGHSRAKVPHDNSGFSSFMVTTLPSISSLQKNFIVPLMKPRPSYTIGIAAPTCNTLITIYHEDGTVLESLILDEQQSVIRTYQYTVFVEASEGILLVQYGDGYFEEDPAVSYIPALSQYSNWYQFFVPASLTNVNNALTIIIDSTQSAGLRLDNVPLTVLSLTTVQTPGITYDVIYVAIDDDTLYTLSHDTGANFAAFMHLGVDYLDYYTTLGYEITL